MGKILTPEDYRLLAKKRGFRWLGPEVPDTKTDTVWECKEGHQWKSPYSRIRSGSRCPFCFGNARKTPADYHALARKRGFRWLGPEVSNSLTKTWWECQHGHQWESRYNQISQGTDCPFCSRRTRKTSTKRKRSR